MRAVKGNLGHSPEVKRGIANPKVLARANGTSQHDNGWVRKLRAVEDQSALIHGELMSELGGSVDK